MIIGTAFAVHGLWAARWMMDVNGIATADITSNLLLMGAGLTIGAATIGMLASWLRARGVGSANIFAGACGLFLLVQLVILTDRQLPAWLPWSCFALFGGMTVLGARPGNRIFDVLWGRHLPRKGWNVSLPG